MTKAKHRREIERLQEQTKLRAEERETEVREEAVRSAFTKHKFVAHEDITPDDVVIVGYPRSGNTWLQIMLAAIVYRLDVIDTPFSLVCEAVPDLSDVAFFRRHGKTMFFKSHSLPVKQYRRVVYLVRDGRDVMVSYRHFREVLDRTQIDLEEFVARPDDDIWPCKWSTHADEWIVNPHAADMIFVRYEDMIAQPALQVRRILDFARLPALDDDITRVCDRATMSLFRQKEKKEGAIPIPQYSGSQPFFRRGMVGSYKDEMSAEALALFMSDAASTLKKFEYV